MPARGLTGRQAAFGGKARLGRPLAGWGQSPPTGSPALPLSGGAAFYGGKAGEEQSEWRGKKRFRAGAGLSPPLALFSGAPRC